MKLTFICCTIWIMSALINAFLGGTLLFLLASQNAYSGVYFIVFTGTLLLSVPGMFIFWLVFIFNRSKLLLFRLLLRAGLCISGVSSVLLFFFSAEIVKGQPLLFALCVVVSFVAAIMAHYTVINTVIHHSNT